MPSSTLKAVCLGLILWVGRANAALLPLPLAFSYEQVSFPNSAVPVTVLADFSRVMTTEGYVVLDSSNTGNIPVFGVDQVYSDPLSRQAVFLKFDLEPTDRMLVGELRSVPGDILVYHSERRRGSQYALVFYRFEPERARQLVSLLRNSVTARAYDIPGINKAHASEPGCAACGGLPQVQRLGGINHLNDNLKANQLGGNLSTCAGDLLKGAWASTGGAVSAIASATVQFTENPAASFKKLGQMMEQMWKFASHFPSEIKRVWQGFSGLDSGMQAQVACEFLGSLGTDVVLGIVTAGVASVKWPLLLAKLEKFAQKLKRLDKLMSYLSKSADQAGQKLRQGVFRRLAGEMDETQINAIKSFSDRDLMDIAVGAASCGI